MTKEWPHIGDAICFRRQIFLWTDIPINEEIAIETLVELFHIQPKVYKRYDGETAIDSPEGVKQALKVLEHLKIERMQERHFKCPFHKMSGHGNLHVFLSASLFCFHCCRKWKNVQEFCDDLKVWRENDNKK